MHDDSDRRGAILRYWNQEEVESMYDKHLLRAEVDLVVEFLLPGVVLDVGCGEGEGTLEYASVPGVDVVGIDFSPTRLEKASARLAGHRNVRLEQVDVLAGYKPKERFDSVVSQRFLINLMDWSLQAKALGNLMDLLKTEGWLIMLEGSAQGAESLNRLRALWGLQPIKERWHNRFIDDSRLCEFMDARGHRLVAHKGLGAYFMLTRAVRAALEPTPAWDCEFNRVASTRQVQDSLGPDSTRFSRLKLWVFAK